MEDFVTFELAKKLREKGFPQDITEKSFFVGDNEKRGCRIGDFVHHPVENKKYLIAAPTISQVLKWLREEKHIAINIEFIPSCWQFTVLPMSFNKDRFKLSGKTFFFSYEQAALAGVTYCLENLI